ncbi:MAG: hypothetical protein R3C28_03940 [Pirellulaceae bacterium]
MRRRHADSSLELLLDTMTNAFGGILFLAILIAISLESQKDEPIDIVVKESSRLELVELQSELERLQAMKRETETNRDLQEQISEHLQQGLSDAKLTELGQLFESQSTLMKRRTNLVSEIAAKQSGINDLVKKVEDARAAMDSKQAEMSNLRILFATQVKTRSKTTKLPRLRATTKSEFALILRFGRIYAMYEGNGDSGVLNSQDFIITQESLTEVTATPKPYRGIPVDDSSRFQRQFDSLLDRVSQDTHYIMVAVWHDSFEQFEFVKNALVESSWKYRLIPVKVDGGIITNASGPQSVQ